MNEVLVRLLVVAAVVVVAGAIAWVLRRYASPPHPDIDVGDVGDRPGVVLFTSTTCPTCKEVIAMYRELRIPYREVTSDLEEQRFDAWGIVAVPVTVIIDADDTVISTFSGLPRKRPLMRALSSASIERG